MGEAGESLSRELFQEPKPPGDVSLHRGSRRFSGWPGVVQRGDPVIPPGPFLVYMSLPETQR